MVLSTHCLVRWEKLNKKWLNWDEQTENFIVLDETDDVDKVFTGENDSQLKKVKKMLYMILQY